MKGLDMENDKNLNENTNLHNSKKSSKFKKILAIVLIALIVGHIGMYVSQRNTWLYKDQPYPKAKEWLIPANFMLVYGNYLTKLPFIDEKSFIMKPILKAQDYFVEKWKANLPDDDAEKYLDWYMFKLRFYIINTSSDIVLNSNGKYSFSEVREFNEKAWQSIENLVKYEAKDKEFQEIRYSAFNNLSLTFTTNFSAYWAKNPKNYFDNKMIFYNLPNQEKTDTKNSTDNSNDYKTDFSFIDETERLQDNKQHERLIKLYDYIKYMDSFYCKNYQRFYIKTNATESAEYSINRRMQELTREILYWQISTNRHLEIENFCDKIKNRYLYDYIVSRDWFFENKSRLDKLGVSFPVVTSIDNKIKSVCQNLNL